MINIPDYPNIKVLKSGKTGLFCNYVFKAIPLAFDESLSYYECLCGLLAYLRDTIIPTVNNNADAVSELQTLYDELHDYVENYFTNLDVQEEINNKLDEMVEDGTLEQIIEQYINSSCVWCFDTIDDMKSAPNLINGSYARTTGYYTANDGGGALYKITENSSETEYQETLESGLYANLVVLGDSVSFKQFGAKNDGLTDNSSIITKALQFVKNKKIGNLFINEGTFVINNTQMIIPDGLHLYGTGKDSIIQVNQLTNEVFMTNEHYLTYTGKDTFILEDFRINKQAIGTHVEGKRCMRFACTDNVVIRNIYYYSDVDSEFGVLDLYSDNTNMLVENCKAYKTNSTPGVLVGGYAIRENSAQHVTENIILRDCLIEKDGKDESLWIDAWHGIVRNVLVDNFKMIDNSGYNGGNSAYIGNEYTGSLCENITIQNSYFYRKDLRYRIFGIGTSELNNQLCYSKNINIINCIFECDTFVGDSSRSNLVDIGGTYPTLVDEGCTIKDCIFKFNDTQTTLGCFIHGLNTAKTLSINNKFYGQVQRGIWEIYSSKDDYFEKAPTTALYTQTPYINNVKCGEKLPYLLIVQASTNLKEVIIENCKQLKCDRLLQNNGNTFGIVYKVIDCQIENDNESTMITNYTQTDELMTLELINTDIKTPNVSTQAEMIYKATGLSVNGETFKGIPGNSRDRANLPVGTVFFSNTPTKSIVRKISEGSSSSNWEEI